MKKLRLWIRDLTLSQQLISIIFMVATVFTVFFMSFLTTNIDELVNRQMFDIISRSQNSVKYLLDENIESNRMGEDLSIVHFIYNIQTKEIVPIFDNIELETPLKTSILSSIYGQEFIEVDDVNSHTSSLYRANKLNDNEYIVSVMIDSYRDEFKKTLLDNVINLNILVILILFAFLMVWVAFIIHPLNQIKTYVSKLSNGEEAHLRIDRRDEIGEVAMAIKYMHEELMKQERIKEEMVQNISHDLKTPIATIKSYGESIKDGIYPYDTLGKSVDVIIEHANRLEKKVYSLIMLNRLGYLNDTAPEGNTLDMVDIINKVILSMKVVKDNVNVTTILNAVNFHGEEEPWRIVVENLLENAIRYTKSEIVITLNEGELEISNDGPLLSRELKERLFKPYEKGSGGNFGLGLSIVYRICTTYGYHVEADNFEDGVTFKIKQLKQTKKKSSN